MNRNLWDIIKGIDRYLMRVTSNSNPQEEMKSAANINTEINILKVYKYIFLISYVTPLNDIKLYQPVNITFYCCIYNICTCNVHNNNNTKEGERMELFWSKGFYFMS